MHGHSHFAFSGWVTQTLMVLMIAFLYNKGINNVFNTYKGLLAANLLTAYGMLIAFPIQGYGAISIAFSTLSIFVSYFFTIKFWRDLNRLTDKSIAHYWFKAAIVFNAISSVGTFGLAYMMSNKIVHQNWYLGSVYFYLHFQYNGWFFFVCMGLLYDKLIMMKKISERELNIIFWMFAASCIPAYFLSALWMPIPVWVFIIVVIASLAQFIAWLWLVKIILPFIKQFTIHLTPLSKWLLALSSLALSIKLFLQLGSTIPSLSQLAFGFRPIVIAYLHLVLLGVITIFLLGFILSYTYLHENKLMKTGVIIFVSGIFLNELVLMLQGITALSYVIIPLTNELLLAMGLIMFSGICMILISQLRIFKK